MKEQFEKELTPEIREKLKKNLVYAGIVSIIMVFAGLISAYIVSMGSTFWVKVPFPTPFFVSTALIVISSLTFILSVNAAKKKQQQKLVVLITLTFLLGLGFVFFQFKGYKALVEKGVYFSANKVLVNEGRYGDYFSLKYHDKYLVVDGNDYLIDGKLVSEETKEKIKEIGKAFEKAEDPNGLAAIKGYGTEFILLYNSEPLAYINNELMLPNGTKIEGQDSYRLRTWAEHIRDGRGDFFIKGQFGNDFKVFYKGKELSYKDRSLYLNDQKLSPYLLNKAMDAADTASSYLYLITFLHLLHIIFTLGFMIRTLTYSYLGKYTNDSEIGLRATGIFWHFLGILWVFLLLFLLFIH